MAVSEGDKPPTRWTRRIEEYLGGVLLGSVAVRDAEWLSQRRWSVAGHAVVFALGLVLVQALGPGWVLMPVASVVHQFLFGARRLLTATAVGLEVIELRSRSIKTVAQIPVGASALVTLRSDQPQVLLDISSRVAAGGSGTYERDAELVETRERLLWSGTVNGSDLKRAEWLIRAGGGEPVRVKRN